MQRLLRGIIDFEDGATQESLCSNYRRLASSPVEWIHPFDAKIYGFVKEFFESKLEIPSHRILRDYFSGTNELEVTQRLKDVEAAPFFTRKNYEYLLNRIVENQSRDKMRRLLKEADEIVTTGITIKEGKERITLKGVKDAIVRLNSKAYDLLSPDHNVRTRGDLREDADTAWQKYQEVKANPERAWGKFTGIEKIDNICHGIKRGELWTHAAFAGQLKTSFATNWAYNLVTRYRTNVFYVSLEMQYEHIQRIIYAIHSAHAKFKMAGAKPLDYRKVRDAQLSAEEEDQYKTVLHDFQTNPEHCRFEVWVPDRNVTIPDIRIEAEILHKEMDVGLIVIDHGGVTESHKKHDNFTVESNAVVREAKRLAMHFNGGEGVPVLFLYQTNRVGYDDAMKNGGRYKMSALSYSNETERSSDYITTTFLDDTHRQNGTTLFCNLKNRDNPLFDPFLASVDFSCRKIYNYDSVSSPAGGIVVDEQDDILNRVGMLL